MASSFPKTNCIICEKTKTTYDCKGCKQAFCLNHLNDHNQQINQQLDELVNQRNIFKQKIQRYQTNLVKNLLIQQIDQWEQQSIEIIQHTAQESRGRINQYMSKYLEKVDIELNKLTNQMKELRNENDFDEIEINYLKNQLDLLDKHHNKPQHIEIKTGSTLIR